MLSHENIHQNKKILRNLPGFEPGAMVFMIFTSVEKEIFPFRG